MVRRKAGQLFKAPIRGLKYKCITKGKDS